MDSARRPLVGTNRIGTAKPPPPPPVPVEPFERHVENFLREHAANMQLDTSMAAVGQRERAQPSVPMPHPLVAPPPLPPPPPLLIKAEPAISEPMWTALDAVASHNSRARFGPCSRPLVAPPPLPPPLPPMKDQRERAATANPLQGLLDLSQAPYIASLAPNVATSSVALAFVMPPPPPPTQDQRERAAARSLLMPPPPVPIHRQKRRNPEPADDYSAKRRLFQSIFKPDDRAKGSAASSVQMPPPPSVPRYRRCPADRQATDFTKELHPKTRATFVMPPPPPKAPGILTWV
jgi:hypothetical protein